VSGGRLSGFQLAANRNAPATAAQLDRDARAITSPFEASSLAMSTRERAIISRVPAI
jgi:hypothetical protein